MFWDKWTKKTAEEEEQKQGGEFSSYSDDELLDQFKSDNWSKLDEDKRIAVIQEMENRKAAEQGRDPATVTSLDDGENYGVYNHNSNTMKIDVEHFSSYDTLDTFAHESNHAYQDYCVDNDIGYDEYTRNMMAVESFQDENGGYYNYAPGRDPYYRMQCDELDSNNEAARFMLSQSERYKDDPEYQQYVNDRIANFSEVNKAMDENSDYRTMRQNNQLDNAYFRGDLSQERYDYLSDRIHDPSFNDPTVQDSHEIESQLRALNNEMNNSNDNSNNQSAQSTQSSEDNGEDNGEEDSMSM